MCVSSWWNTFRQCTELQEGSWDSAEFCSVLKCGLSDREEAEHGGLCHATLSKLDLLLCSPQIKIHFEDVFLVSVCACCTWIYVCEPHTCALPEEARRRVSGILELEVEKVVNCHVDAGSQARGPLLEQRVCLNLESSFQLLPQMLLESKTWENMANNPCSLLLPLPMLLVPYGTMLLNAVLIVSANFYLFVCFWDRLSLCSLGFLQLSPLLSSPHLPSLNFP